MVGQIIVYLGFAASIITTLLYFFSLKNDKLVKPGRIAYNVTLLAVLFMSAYFLANILSHNYQMAYIYKYSSNELPFGLLLSTFYAGQEGSIMLWLLFYSIAGVALMAMARKYKYEKQVMSVYSMIPMVLLLMLISKSPFLNIQEAFPQSNIPPDFMPENGNGLNPILENYWMVIHPPILFIGYVLVSIPYIIGVAGLINNDKNVLSGFGYRWILLGTGVLGLGLMLGGFWAYETLGWGGFWGWDPVENSSLLPWLSSVALVHTILVQRKSGGLVRTNFFLSILTFVLVLYATFLTRSGVLGDFSVHSFVDPGTVVYTILLSTIIIFGLLGLVMLLIRYKELGNDKNEFKMISKENFMAIGSILLLLSLAVTMYGTSFPIISAIFSETKSSVEISFYNKMNMPIYVLVLFFTYITPFLKWKSTKLDGIIKKSIAPAILAVAATAGVLITYDSPFNQYTLIIFMSFLSLFANLSIVFSKHITYEKMPGLISHAGLALVIVGAVISGYYEVKKVMMFTDDAPQELRDRQYSYVGYKRIEREKKDREKYQYTILIDGDKNKSAEPIFYWSQFNEFSSPFLEPGIYSTLLTDYYVSPNSIENDIYEEALILAIGETKPLPFNTSHNLTLVDFDISKFMSFETMEEIPLAAIIELNGKRDTLYTIFNNRERNFSPQWKSFPGIDYKIGVASLVMDDNMENPKAQFQFLRERLVVEVSEKPMINLVWLGTVLMVGGFCWAFARRKTKDIS